MASKTTISIQPDPKQLTGLYDALRTLDKDANNQLKTDVIGISQWTATRIKASANLNPYPKQAAKALETTAARRDRVPTVAIGGSRQKYSGGAVAGNIIFGSEFGANPTSINGRFPNGGRRFPFPSKGYGIFATLKQIQPEITRQWKAAVDKVLNEWSKG
jgi:hypothetical protein